MFKALFNLRPTWLRTAWSPDTLPPELWYNITDLLDLADVAALAFTCKRLMALLQYSWKELDQPNNNLQKLRLLRRLDRYLPSKLFCTKCCKFYDWSRKTGASRTHGGMRLITPKSLNVAETFRLVMRAQNYGDTRHGLPVKALRADYHEGQWRIESHPIFADMGVQHLIWSTWKSDPKSDGKDVECLDRALESYSICNCEPTSERATGLTHTIRDDLKEASRIMDDARKQGFRRDSGTCSDRVYHTWKNGQTWKNEICRECGVRAGIYLRHLWFRKCRIQVVRWYQLHPNDINLRGFYY